MRCLSGAGDLSSFLPCPGASDPLSDLKSQSIGSETTFGARQGATGGTQRDGVGRAAVARLRLFLVGGESEKTCLPGGWESSFCCLPEFPEWVWVRSGSHECDCNAGISSYFLASTIRPAQLAESGFGKVFCLAWDRFPSWRLVWALSTHLTRWSTLQRESLCVSRVPFGPWALQS